MPRKSVLRPSARIRYSAIFTALKQQIKIGAIGKLMTNESHEMREVAVGRSCGTCSLCCKLPPIEKHQVTTGHWFEKKAGKWCEFCKPGTGGCKIYDSRPEVCSKYLCMWLTNSELGPEWYPQKSKIVLSPEHEGNRLTIYVDPAVPNRWREEPYYSQIKHWGRTGFEQQFQVLIYIGYRVIAVLPNKEVDLGICNPDDHIMTGEIYVPPGHTRDWGAYIKPASDIPVDKRDAWQKSKR